VSSRGSTFVSLDSSGNLYVSDTSNHTIRKITPAGAVTTLAGSPGQPGAVNGNGSNARFNYPRGLAVDGAGNLFVADRGNHAIRKVTPSGEVSTFAIHRAPLPKRDGWRISISVLRRA
jgi:sugar lactone lactonase YvrE